MEDTETTIKQELRQMRSTIQTQQRQISLMLGELNVQKRTLKESVEIIDQLKRVSKSHHSEMLRVVQESAIAKNQTKQNSIAIDHLKR